MTARTLADVGGRTDNAFGCLRLALALMVLLSHCYPLGGFGDDDPLRRWSHGQESFGSLAVLGFFAISGYLIGLSSLEGGTVHFLLRRILRIFPGFLAALAAVALVVGPALWWLGHRTLDGYFLPYRDGPWRYLLANAGLRIHQTGIRDLLVATTPYGRFAHASILDGSLWTLVYEWHAYLIVAALVWLRAPRRMPAIAAGLAAVFYVLMVAELVVGTPAQPVAARLTGGWIEGLNDLRFLTSFLIGTALAHLGGRVPLDDRLGAGACLLALATLGAGGFAVVGLFGFGYGLLWLAYRLPAPLTAVGRDADYSYGCYIYGFVVQQLLAYAGLPAAGFASFLAGSVLLAMALAWLSWNLVEKRALALKGRVPGTTAWRWPSAVKRTGAINASADTAPRPG